MVRNIEEFFKSATDEQKGILLKIVESSKEEKVLCNKVNNVYDSIKRGVHSPDGFSITVCEDEDDATIISAKDKEGLERVRAQIANYMKEAVKLGIGDVGIIQRNYKDYVGENIPSPKV